MHRRRTVLFATAAGIALLLAGAGTAIAVTRPDAPDRSAKHDAFLADVAGRLGVTPEQLRDAFRDAAHARVDRLLQEGSITQEQAQRFRSRIDAGGPLAGGPGPRFGPGPALHRGGWLGFGLDAAAEYLDLTGAELREALRGGSSLADVARAEGASVDGLKQALVAAGEARLDAAEQAGRIDAERKERLLDRLSQQVDRLVERTGGPPWRSPGKRRR